MTDALNEYAYPATLAGLQYGVDAGVRGISVKIAGYDDRQRVLLDKILHGLVARQFSAERFAAIKTEMLREWANSTKRRPFLQLVDEMRATLVLRDYRDAELLVALEPLTPADLDGF